jgi:hypothetical protein
MATYLNAENANMIGRGCKRGSGSIPVKARCDILRAVMQLTYLAVTAAVLLGSAVTLSAEYVLVLKNGRQISVQNYREEGSMIKFQGFGGEIGIAKDQLQTIRKIGPEGPLGLNVMGPAEPVPARSPESAQLKPETAVAEEPGVTEDERAREEGESIYRN